MTNKEVPNHDQVALFIYSIDKVTVEEMKRGGK